LKCVGDICEHYRALVMRRPPLGRICIEPLVEVLHNPPSNLACLFEGHFFEDDFGGETRALVFGPSSGLTFRQAYEKSSWKEAVASLWRDRNLLAVKTSDELVTPLTDTFEGTTTIPAFARRTPRAS
jgi:hypothetical protein